MKNTTKKHGGKGKAVLNTARKTGGKKKAREDKSQQTNEGEKR